MENKKRYAIACGIVNMIHEHNEFKLAAVILRKCEKDLAYRKTLGMCSKYYSYYYHTRIFGPIISVNYTIRHFE